MCRFETQKLDEPEPIMQIGNHFFQGSLQRTMGTSLCFEEIKQQDDDYSRAKRVGSSRLSSIRTTSKSEKDVDKRNLAFLVKSDKTMNMKRVFLQPKST